MGCENASKLNVKNIIMKHAEDRNILNKIELNTEEGKEYFAGNIIVPDDLDIIDCKHYYF